MPESFTGMAASSFETRKHCATAVRSRQKDASYSAIADFSIRRERMRPSRVG